MNQKKICIILGTRPEIIKLFPLIKIFQKQRRKFFIIFSKQHYSPNMSLNFFKELKILRPKYIFSNSNKKKFTNLFYKYTKNILDFEKPEKVIVHGDTNTAVVGCLASRHYFDCNKNVRNGLVHVESGLRSYDRSMPEETNRIIIDHNSDILFVPTSHQKKNLIKEKINKKRIYIVGNTISDSLKIIRPVPFMSKNNLNYLLVTFHRHGLLESKYRLKKLINSLNKISEELNTKILISMHPRTKKKISSLKYIFSSNIKIIKPTKYGEFLNLILNSNLVLSDSGGLQEECCILKKMHITLRLNTERPETLSIGSNYLAGFDVKKILQILKKKIACRTDWKHPYGNNVSRKINEILNKL
jgi:UDP-N-acetylglucosamine 2-epimerase (non-hydrolysing)